MRVKREEGKEKGDGEVREGRINCEVMPYASLIPDIQKTLYSSTVCTMVFSTAEAVPLPVYGRGLV